MPSSPVAAVDSADNFASHSSGNISRTLKVFWAVAARLKADEPAPDPKEYNDEFVVRMAALAFRKVEVQHGRFPASALKLGICRLNYGEEDCLPIFDRLSERHQDAIHAAAQKTKDLEGIHWDLDVAPAERRWRQRDGTPWDGNYDTRTFLQELLKDRMGVSVMNTIVDFAGRG